MSIHVTSTVSIYANSIETINKLIKQIDTDEDAYTIEEVDSDSHYVQLTLESRWNPPWELFETFVKKHPDVEIRCEYYTPTIVHDYWADNTEGYCGVFVINKDEIARRKLTGD